jgi:CubicO group peptidase (beta-lactamase class C family)
MIALVAAFALASVVIAQDPRAARVDSIMAPLNSANGPGAQVAVLKDGKIVLERGYGLAQLEYNTRAQHPVSAPGAGPADDFEVRGFVR